MYLYFRPSLNVEITEVREKSLSKKTCPCLYYKVGILLVYFPAMCGARVSAAMLLTYNTISNLVLPVSKKLLLGDLSCDMLSELNFGKLYMYWF